jgi:soluble lytic murein transglycosylase-like protein
MSRKTSMAAMCLALLGLVPSRLSAQITQVIEHGGRRIFVNADPPAKLKLEKAKSPATIYLPAESSFTGRGRPAVYLDHDGAERIIREAAQRHQVDPALVRAVIATESNFNPGAISRKGARGLMQLEPGTALQYGVTDAFNPRQNINAGVRHLRTLLDRYSGNLDLALAAYNAGQGAVDRHRGIPPFRETRNYVQKVQDAYFRPGSGRLANWWTASRPIYKETDERGRVIFKNE